MNTLLSLSSVSVGGRGKVNTTLIHTQKGKTILLKIALTVPQPYSRVQTMVGTKGYSSRYPQPIVQTEVMKQGLQGEEALEFMKNFQHSQASHFVNEGKGKKVPNVMNYAMDARLIYCLRHGLPLDIDVYDAAEWSCICELSEQSALLGGKVVEVPDFTCGHWHEAEGHRFYE